MQREKVTVHSIVLGGDGKPVSVILSDGKELDGLWEVSPDPVRVDCNLSVVLGAYLSDGQDGT